MQKGKLGSVVAGVLAIFLVIVCLFYISFTLVTNHYDNQARDYAVKVSGDATAVSDSYTKAYKHYIDSIFNETVWLGYTYSQAQKLGVGLGLDLKGGMNVTLQVSVPDILRSMANAEGNPYFERAIASADSVAKATRSNDYVSIFCKEYRKLDPAGDFSVIFKDQVERGQDDNAAEAALKQEVKDRVSSSTNVLRTCQPRILRDYARGRIPGRSLAAQQRREGRLDRQRQVTGRLLPGHELGRER